MKKYAITKWTSELYLVEAKSKKEAERLIKQREPDTVRRDTIVDELP